MKSNFAVDGRTHAEYRKTKSEMQDWLVAQKIMQENLKEDEQKKSSCMSREKKIERIVDDGMQCRTEKSSCAAFFCAYQNTGTLCA